ncbi:hypothetical protein PI124_g18145 [Phytophthora idaei]|nr:hypothetical protein PI124_g18145 [Phytophthora idaei]
MSTRRQRRRMFSLFQLLSVAGRFPVESEFYFVMWCPSAISVAIRTLTEDGSSDSNPRLLRRCVPYHDSVFEHGHQRVRYFDDGRLSRNDRSEERVIQLETAILPQLLFKNIYPGRFLL